jgi:hypothetical protein
MRLRPAPSGLALLVAQRPPRLRLAVVTTSRLPSFARGVGFGRRLFYLSAASNSSGSLAILLAIRRAALPPKADMSGVEIDVCFVP